MNALRISVASFIVAVLLNGCAAPAPPGRPSAPPAQTVSVTDKQDDIQNSREWEMVVLFQSLLQMNRREHLSISAKQADSLLPIIKRNSSAGELAQADLNGITGMLNVEQKQYVDDFMEETRLRKEHFKQLKEQKGISEEERDQMIRDFLTKRAQERDGQLPPPRRGNPEESSSPGQGNGPGGKNIEQQLIDVLEAKLLKESGK